MRELMFQTNIARRVDLRIAGSQEVVDVDSCFGVVADTSYLKIHAFDIGGSADAGQYYVNGNAKFFAAGHEIDYFSCALQTNCDHRGIEMNLDPITRQGI